MHLPQWQLTLKIDKQRKLLILNRAEFDLFQNHIPKITVANIKTVFIFQSLTSAKLCEDKLPESGNEFDKSHVPSWKC